LKILLKFKVGKKREAEVNERTLSDLISFIAKEKHTKRIESSWLQNTKIVRPNVKFEVQTPTLSFMYVNL